MINYATEAEVIKRNEIIAKARALYVFSGKTRNITDALRAYLQNDAGPDEHIELYISTPIIFTLNQVIDKKRPKCEDCGHKMKLKLHTSDINGTRYNSSWLCSFCGIEHYSDMTAIDWIKEFTDENRE